MYNLSPVWTMIGLDVLMVVYSLWILSTVKPLGKLGPAIAASMLCWLLALHWGLANERLFPKDISGLAFLAIIFAAVGIVGAVLLFVPQIRRLLFGLGQQELMLLQGIRVFFGATFLMHASFGVLPQTLASLTGSLTLAPVFLVSLQHSR